MKIGYTMSMRKFVRVIKGNQVGLQLWIREPYELRVDNALSTARACRKN